MVGRAYYVDADLGNDGYEGLSAAAPLRTLAEATRRLSKHGGDGLFLKGRFRETLVLDNINSGLYPDPGLPTVVQCAFDGNGQPVEAVIDGGISGAKAFPFDCRGLPPGFGAGEGGYLDRGIVVNECNYVTVSGVTVRGIAGIGVLSWRSSDLRLQFVDVSWTSESAMMLANGLRTDPMTRRLAVANCRIDQSNLGRWTDYATRSGFNMKSETMSIVAWEGFEIYGNHVSNSLMEGIDFKLGSRNGSLHNNLVENTRSAGIYVNEGDDSSIYHNVVRHIGYYDPADGSGLQLAAPYLLSMIPGVSTSGEEGSIGILIGNGDLDPFSAYETGRSSGLRVYENVVSWTRKNAISIWNEWRAEGSSGWLLDDIHIYNNVAYRSCLGSNPVISAIQVDTGATHSTIRNNIIVGSGRTAMGIWMDDGSFYATSAISDNLFHDNAENGELGTGSLFGDPRFIQPPASAGANADFQLQAGSPAIGRGFNTPLSQTSGNGIDLGAYQFGLPPWTIG